MNPPNLVDTLNAVKIARQVLEGVEIPDDLLWTPFYLAVARAKRHLNTAWEHDEAIRLSEARKFAQMRPDGVWTGD